ncbi:MAG: FRG domain-containing protein [Flavobacterium sp.]|nr:FRG domain-containing protein [Flavobacterium sp.]
MKKILIKSIKELEQYKQNPGSIQFYRGESRSYDTPMMSGIYRNADGLSINELQKRETKYFNLFKKKVVSKDIIAQDPFPNQLEFYKEWFWLFQAQHLGLKTRLIDFTVDMKIALLFAVNQWKDDNENGRFWIFNCGEDIKITESKYKKYSIQTL